MAKFNATTKAVTAAKRKPNTVNLAGGQAHKQSAKDELVAILLTSFVGDKFYKSAKAELGVVEKLISSGAVDPLFAAKAAVFARNEYGMRSISHVVAAHIARNVKGATWTRPFFDAVVARPDDVTEILSFYLDTYGKPIPNALKDGLGKALTGFDAYAIAKYKGGGKSMSLIKAMKLTHPMATEALTALSNGTLAPADTWETGFAKAGEAGKADDNTDELKADVWKRLLRENKLGYFALLRNLRNIAKTQDDEIIKLACTALVNEKAIRRSKVMPFRYLVALGEVGEIIPTSMKIALLNAIEIAVGNIPMLDGTSLVAIDVSGSMCYQQASYFSKSATGRYDDDVADYKTPTYTASVLGAALYKHQHADIILFDGRARYMQGLNHLDSVATITNVIRSNTTGGSTNFSNIFKVADKPYDRVFILSDMQGWDTYWTPARELTEYKLKYGVDPFIYSIDLAGYGTTQFPEGGKLFKLAGFSEKMFDILALLEQDKDALVHKIEAIEF